MISKRLVAFGQDRRPVQSANDPHTPFQLVHEREARLRRPIKCACQLPEQNGTDAERSLPQLKAFPVVVLPNEGFPRVRLQEPRTTGCEKTGNVDRLDPELTSSPELFAKLEQVHLTPGLPVNQRRREASRRNPLDFDAPPTAHADVDVLAAGPRSGPHMARASAHASDQQNRLLDLVRGDQFRCRDSLDERHAEPVGPPHHQMSHVAHFPATVLFDAYLRYRQLPAPKGNLTVHAHDRSALKPRRNAAVQVLLPRDVDLVDDGIPASDTVR